MSPARRDRGESSASLLAAVAADAEGGLEALRVPGALSSFGLKFILLMFCGGGLCDIARCRLLLNGSASRQVLRPQDEDVTNIACVLTTRSVRYCMSEEEAGVLGRPWEPGQR